MSGWKDAYESQMETWRWVRSPEGRHWRGEHQRLNSQGLSGSTQELIRSVYAAEEVKLLEADPFFVSAEMCEVIAAASETFKLEPLLETDLLTTTGYVHFEQPFRMPDKYETIIELGGFSWCLLGSINGRWTEEGDILGVDEDYAGPRVRGVVLTLYSAKETEEWNPGWGPPPARIPMHHTPWWFGMTFDGNEIDELGARTGTERWWQLVQTTLRLMQQRLAVRHSERPDRSSRRRAKRYSYPDDREVVVVRLRREKSEAHGVPLTEANYSHRFIVSGHWRNAWFSTSQTHRQIWIHPYVKGPEDKELVVRPRRVFALTR